MKRSHDVDFDALFDSLNTGTGAADDDDRTLADVDDDDLDDEDDED
jgi:hypothetical protein